MKHKWCEHLSDNVLISNINGKLDVVTFRSTTAKILQKFFDMPKVDNPVAEEHRIVKAAEALIKRVIKSQQTSKEHFPDTDAF